MKNMEQELAWQFITAFFKCMRNNRFDMHLAISMKQFMLLASIFLFETEHSRCITVSELAERLGVSRPAISQMVNMLEEKNYLQRMSRGGDRRIVGISVTERGKEEMEHARLQCIEYTAHRLEKMGADKTRTLISLLEEFSAMEA